MIERGYYVSRSGLRPMSAFVVLGGVILGVAGRVTALALDAEAPAAPDLHVESGAPLDFQIADREGRVLAAFVDRYELQVSPRAMWQAHTPDYMAAQLVDVLQLDMAPDELLAEMMPDRRGGAVEVAAWELGADSAASLDAAIRERGLDEWMGFRQSPDAPDAWRLVWDPTALLSKEVRGERAPWTWTRTLADLVAVALWSELNSGEPQEREDELLERRDLVWEAMMPSTWSLALRAVPCDRLVALRDMLREEGVMDHQMWLAPARERLHPAGESLLLGSWGWVDNEPGAAEPRGGLERMCAAILRDPATGAQRGAPGTYTFRRDVVARRGSRPYFQGASAPTARPTVHLTLDLELQRRLGDVLEETLATHRAAIAMGIALDLETGAVLALDSRERWDLSLFAPIHHQFTPGSTFKILTMGLALDLGAVTPGDPIDVGERTWHVPGSTRVIREAEGSKRGVISATDCLAYSMNTGMAQIGLRIPADVFHDTLASLGYGRAPHTGLGHEAAGWLTPLKGGTWSRAYTHASVSFGHEVSTTLWQHAAGLAAVLRGGVWRPLRLLEFVEGADGEVAWLPPGSLNRVFSADACALVRDMMRKGAEEGTGRHVFRPDVSMLTKTGTAEKVSTERCIHVLGRALAAAAAEGRVLGAEERRALPLRGAHSRSCYTSSICMVGRAPTGGPERMVLVVVEEPTGEEKYGSRVAGPAARAILEAALGVGPEPSSEAPVAELAGAVLPRAAGDRPWAEDAR